MTSRLQESTARRSPEAPLLGAPQSLVRPGTAFPRPAWSRLVRRYGETLHAAARCYLPPAARDACPRTASRRSLRPRSGRSQCDRCSLGCLGCGGHAGPGRCRAGPPDDAPAALHRLRRAPTLSCPAGHRLARGSARRASDGRHGSAVPGCLGGARIIVARTRPPRLDPQL